MKDGIITFVVLALICAVSYTLGHGKAEAEGRAALNALRVEQSEEKRRAADAYGKALADTLTKYQGEVARADSLAANLLAQDRAHETQSRDLRRQIAHVAKNSAVTLGPDTVRLLNQAAGISDTALSAALCAPGADAGTGACPAPDAGLLAGVSEADLVDWFIDFAGRARWLEGRLLAWQAWYRGYTAPEREKD